jgi:hypothetical protein
LKAVEVPERLERAANHFVDEHLWRPHLGDLACQSLTNSEVPSFKDDHVVEFQEIVWGPFDNPFLGMGGCPDVRALAAGKVKANVRWSLNRRFHSHVRHVLTILATGSFKRKERKLMVFNLTV